MPLLFILAGAAIIIELMKPTKSPEGPNLATKVSFVSRLRAIAKRVEQAGAVDSYTGQVVPPGIKADFGLAVVAHESNYGTSDKAIIAHNLVGFTAEEGTYWRSRGFPYSNFPTMEEVKGKLVPAVRPFRSYDSWEESYIDWARLISRQYPAAFAAAVAGDFKAFTLGLKGYASDSRYSEKVYAVGQEVSQIVA